MSETLTFAVNEIRPAKSTVLESQGIGAGQTVPPRIDVICSQALESLARLAEPRGLWAEISVGEFGDVYAGEGRNEPRTPVGDTYGRAEQLALFAVTVGPEVGHEIDRCFRTNDLALGSMLDTAASAATDRLAEALQERYARSLSAAANRSADTAAVLRYSPGYCGWHLSGQRRLFEYLHPERIGITLRESYLMQPLKSISGVLIAGPKQIHAFSDTYPFCERCGTHGCQERIRAACAL